MNQQTPRFSLPFIMPAQALRYLTHNEALSKLDLMGCIAVQRTGLSSPPDTPEAGQCFIVSSDPDGIWAGLGNAIVRFDGSDWNTTLLPFEGLLAFTAEEEKFVLFRNGIWVDLNIGSAAETQFTRLAVNTDIDLQNRFVAKSEFSLFSHETDQADVRVNLNKAETSAAAAILFSKNYSAQAQIGLLGQDNFSIEVSSDGQTFSPAIEISSQTGAVRLANGLEGDIDMTGVPRGGLAGFNELFIDAVNGDDGNTGTSAVQPIKTVARLKDVLPVGKNSRLYVLSDLNWDSYVQLSYAIPRLLIIGSSSSGQYTQRTITVRDAENVAGYPGCLACECFANIALVNITLDLASTSAYPFLYFDGSFGFFTSENLTLRRSGTGAGHAIGTHRCFVPNFHTNLSFEGGAEGYLLHGIAAGENPNDSPQYTSNIVSA